MYSLSMFLILLSDIGADVLDLSGSTLELGDKLKLEPVSFFVTKCNLSIKFIKRNQCNL